MPGASASELRGTRCAVTGGAGVLGRAVVAALVEAGATVLVLDRAATSPVAAPGPVSWAQGDVGDYRWLADVLAPTDAVVHLAGQLPQALLGEEGFIDANVRPTEAVARAAAKAGARGVVLASTIEVYGAQDMSTPLTEAADTLGTGPYSRSKLHAEVLLRRLGAELGMATVALRLPMILGPGFHHERSTLAILDALRRGWPVPVPGWGERPVSYVSAADAAHAFERATAAAIAGSRVDGRAYNVAAPDCPTMRQLFEGVAAAIGSSSRVVGVPWPLVRGALRLAQVAGKRRGALAGTPVELLAFVETGGAYDIAASRTDLGYSPRHDCVTAWAELYRWWAGQRSAAHRGTGGARRHDPAGG